MDIFLSWAYIFPSTETCLFQSRLINGLVGTFTGCPLLLFWSIVLIYCAKVTAMKARIGQTQIQAQKLSPQQIQLMKLLQVPTVMMDQRIKEELEINPALEEGPAEQNEQSVEERELEHPLDNDFETSEEGQQEDAFELDDYLNDYLEDDPSSYRSKSGNYGGEEEDKQVPIALEYSFREHLEQQMHLLELNSDKQETIALQLIGSIDEDGYLRRDPVALVDDLLFAQNIQTNEAEILEVLHQIQRLDPPGVGARDPREALLLQLENKLENLPSTEKEERSRLQLAHRMLGKYFESFSKKHFDRLQRQLGVKEGQLRSIVEEVQKLNPKPASGYAGGASSRNQQYVVPDFIIYNRDGELELELNTRNTPDLRISDSYRDMLRQYAGKDAISKLPSREKDTLRFVRQKVESARWFIDAIRQRHDTMYRTMQAILHYQYDYFLTGDPKKLKPMILQNIADITGLDVSTISRVANSKFVQTEFGTKPLKDFFSEAMVNQEGEEISTLEIKKTLSEIVESENKKRPFSDEKLAELLKEKGYAIARRTVTKYRDQLGISKASLRKEL